MKISGFTMVRNATKYYFPIKESIESVLPIVDEFVVALGDCTPGDKTRAEIESIKSDKIRIIDRVWDEQLFMASAIFAHETNFALSQCKGEWCLYMQADEVIHENDLETIKKACIDNLENKEIDGLLFDYYHFFGDYDHYLPYHGWYKNEIRIVRNNIGVYSIKDAQSFRKNNNEKLNVLHINAHIYHYGWVRPPHTMQSKKKEHDIIHNGQDGISEQYKSENIGFDFGPLGKIPVFKGSHPKVMDDLRRRISWTKFLNYSKTGEPDRPKMKHEKTKYRVLTWIEKKFNNGNYIFGYSNWNLIKHK